MENQNRRFARIHVRAKQFAEYNTAVGKEKVMLHIDLFYNPLSSCPASIDTRCILHPLMAGDA